MPWFAPALKTPIKTLKAIDEGNESVSSIMDSDRESSDEKPDEGDSPHLKDSQAAGKSINIRKLMKTNEAVASEMKELENIQRISEMYQSKQSS